MKTIILILTFLMTISCNAKSANLSSFNYDRSGGGDLQFTITREANNFKIQVTRQNFANVKKELILPINDPMAKKLMPVFEGQWQFEEAPKPAPGVMGGTWLTIVTNSYGKTQKYERARLNHKDGDEVLISLYFYISPPASDRN